MTKDELVAAALASGIDVAEEEYGGVAGLFLHWNNPNDPDDGECSFVPLDQIEGMVWDTLRKDVIHGREVTHMSRIVGYYSKTSNWNKSKIGELNDRRRGNYSLEGVAKWADTIVRNS